MATNIRRSSAIRQTQRKLISVVKLLQERSDIQDVYDELHESNLNEDSDTVDDDSDDDTNMMGFLFDEHDLAAYEDDVNSFVADVEACFKAYRQKTGYRYIPLWLYFREIMTDYFGESVQFCQDDGPGEPVVNMDDTTPSQHEVKPELPKKRTRADLDTSAGAEIEELGPVVKKQLQILSELSRMKCCRPFLTPVDPESAPGYLDMIAIPMDLSTLKGKVVSRTYGDNIDAFSRDLDLIWSNCMTYNTPGSQIYQWAEEARGISQQLFQRKFKVLLNRRSKRALEEAPDTTSSDIDENKLKILKKFILTVWQHPLAVPFHYPVDVRCAPGYEQVVKQPMDLTRVKESLPFYASRSTDNIKACLADVELVFENCRLYNVEGSELHKAATELSTFAQSTFTALFSEKKQSRSSKGGADCASSKREVSELDKKVNMTQIDTPVLQSLDDEEQVETTDLDTPYEELLAQRTALDDDSAVNCAIIRQRAFASSNKFYRQFQRKVLSEASIDEVDGIYKCVALGKIDTGPGFHCKEYIYPVGFLCRRTLVLSAVPSCSFSEGEEGGDDGGEQRCEEKFQVGERIKARYKGRSRFFSGTVSLVRNDGTYDIDYDDGDREIKVKSSFIRAAPADENAIGAMNHLHGEVEFVTSVSREVGGVPRFAVTVGDGILVAVSQESPRKAWQQAMSHGKLILRALGSKFNRCRAVLNRLCTMKGIEPFLEEVPAKGAVGQAYYNVITAPMWLGEVNRRLNDGSYEYEFDFAWDVRLVFKNCMQFNCEGSTLYSTAESALELFELLFCHWVLNVQDVSVHDLAQGPWDDWLYLKYFQEDKEIERCRVTGVKGTKKDPLLFCNGCEDCYRWDVADVGNNEKTVRERNPLWLCKRCVHIKSLESSPSSLLPVERFRRYCVHPTSVYEPAPDIGPGWAKSTPASTKSMKYLSPLGYEFSSMEEVVARMAKEQEIDEKLRSDRAQEYRNQRNVRNTSQSEVSLGVTSCKKRKRPSKEKRHFEASDASFDDVNDKLMLRSKMARVVLEGCSIIWAGLVEDPSAGGVRLTSFSADSIPGAGFSGLDDPVIHRLVEGMEGSLLCQKYVYTQAHSILRSLRKSIAQALARKENIVRGERLLADKVEKELEYWRKQERDARGKAKSMATQAKGVHLTPENSFPHVNNLLTPFIPESWGISYDEFEIVIQTWEFLYLAKSSIGNRGFGLIEIAMSLLPGENPVVPSISGSIFDEICCALTDFMLTSTRAVVFPNQVAAWQDFLSLHPLNLITWPHIAHKVLMVSAYLQAQIPISVTDAQELLRSPMSSTQALCRETLCVVECHPQFADSTEKYPTLGKAAKEVRDKLITSAGDCDDFSIFCGKLNTIFFTSTKVDTESFPYLWLKQILDYYTNIEAEGECLETGSPFYSSKLMDDQVCNDNLRITLATLRTRDPETLTKPEKLRVLLTLLMYSATSTFIAPVVARLNSERAKKVPIPDVRSVGDNALTALKQSLEPVEVTKMNKCHLKCFFSEIEARNIGDGGTWVVVPEEFLHPPSLAGKIAGLTGCGKLEDQTSVGSRSDEECDRPVLRKRRRESDSSHLQKKGNKVAVCLVSSLLRIFAAREAAVEELQSKMPPLHSIMDFSGDAKSLVGRIYRKLETIRSLPLGYDRNGREYWVLNAQDRDLLNGMNPLTVHSASDEPAVLVCDRASNDQWFYIARSKVEEFLANLSCAYPCELFLWKRCSLRFSVIRHIVPHAQKVVSSQQHWLVGYRRVESWLRDITTSLSNSRDPLDDDKLIRLMELAFSRCTELRLCVHYAMINADMLGSNPSKGSDSGRQRDLRKKIQRNRIVEQTLDLHSNTGWHRSDNFSSVRTIGCITLATRILCDPALIETVQTVFKRSSFRRPNLHLADIPKQSSDSTQNASKRHAPAAKDKMMESSQSVLKNEEEVHCPSSEVLPAGMERMACTTTKPVEQLHIETGKVLRRWESGRKAASAMQVSQSGISLCCSGVKNDAFGFKWRFCKAIVPKIEPVSIEELLHMKTCHRKPLQSAQADALEASRSTSDLTWFSRAVSQTTMERTGPVRDIVASTVPVSYRILKLKVELLNMIAILPETVLQWRKNGGYLGDEGISSRESTQSHGKIDTSHAPTNSSTEATESSNGTILPVDCVNSTITGIRNPSGNSDLSSNISIENSDRCEAEIQGSGNDDMDRGDEIEDVKGIENVPPLESFITRVQKASGPGQLLNLIVELELILSPVAFPGYSPLGFVSRTAESTASVATRLFSLDRALRYEDLPLNTACDKVGYRPRTSYGPRCLLSPQCTKPLCHSGRCNPVVPIEESRYREVTPNSGYCSLDALHSGNMGDTRHSLAPRVPQYSSLKAVTPSLLSAPAKVQVTDIGFNAHPPITVEAIQPYVPNTSEVTDTEWV